MNFSLMKIDQWSIHTNQWMDVDWCSAMMSKKQLKKNSIYSFVTGKIRFSSHLHWSLLRSINLDSRRKIIRNDHSTDEIHRIFSNKSIHWRSHEFVVKKYFSTRWLLISTTKRFPSRSKFTVNPIDQYASRDIYINNRSLFLRSLYLSMARAK